MKECGGTCLLSYHCLDTVHEGSICPVFVHVTHSPQLLFQVRKHTQSPEVVQVFISSSAYGLISVTLCADWHGRKCDIESCIYFKFLCFQGKSHLWREDECFGHSPPNSVGVSPLIPVGLSELYESICTLFTPSRLQKLIGVHRQHPDRSCES